MRTLNGSADNPLASLRFEEAIWQAIARSYTNEFGIALRIARWHSGA